VGLRCEERGGYRLLIEVEEVRAFRGVEGEEVTAGRHLCAWAPARGAPRASGALRGMHTAAAAPWQQVRADGGQNLQTPYTICTECVRNVYGMERNVYGMCTECVRNVYVNVYGMCTECVRNVYRICTGCV